MSPRTDQSSPLRVVFCTTPSIYSDLVLQELIRSPRITLVGLVNSTRILRKTGWAWWDALQLVRRTGLRYAAYLWLVTSGYTLLSYLRPNHVRKHLRQQAVPLHNTRDINSPASTSFVQACAPDLLLSAHFNQLIGSELLALPPQGCLNIHPGKLADYKGVDPVIHAVARGELQIGVTLHRLDQGIDSGPLVATDCMAVAPGTSLLSVNSMLFRSGGRLLREILSSCRDLPAGTPQQPAAGYDSWPDPTVVTAFRKTGRKLASVLDFLAISCFDPLK